MRKGNRRKASPEHRLKMLTKAMRRDQEHLRRQSELDRMAQGHRWDPSMDAPRLERPACNVAGVDVQRDRFLVVDEAATIGPDVLDLMRETFRAIEADPWFNRHTERS